MKFSATLKIANIINKANMDKMQRKELKQSASQLKRAQNAKRAKKAFAGPSSDGLGFDKPSEEYVMSAEEMERSFETAQLDAEQAFQVVESYGEKVQATKIRIDAILGRYIYVVLTFFKMACL